MDTPTSKELSLDVARELLIAISQSLPDNYLPISKSVKEHSNGDHGDATMNRDGSEELRSELISISYVPSPDKIELLSINGHPGVMVVEK